MQKQQVFKVKGMQRDASMANTNGEFAYEIINMRLMPSEENSVFSLTNEQGTKVVLEGNIDGDILGQCPTTDSLVVFTKGDNRDYIYNLTKINDEKWVPHILYEGNLNFSIEHPIEAIFNYETQDIQKVYWIDGYNQLRCINIKGTFDSKDNDSQFDSVKEIESLPSVEITRGIGGAFAAGVIQYYITYFNEFSSESPIIYTSPLLYIANENRGAEVNTLVNTSYGFKISDLDVKNWNYIRIYATHRTSLDATPEGAIIQEIKIPNTCIIDFADFGSNRTSITPSDLYFKGGKFVKAGTMTVKDQVMFLGNLKSDTNNSIDYFAIKNVFDELRENGLINDIFSTSTTKQKTNVLNEYENTSYYYKSNLNNTESITHYKYGEKYRFGIMVMDKYGNWSNPIWLKDDYIKTPPKQIDSSTLELACPSLNLASEIIVANESFSIANFLQKKGAVQIKPVVVFPSLAERKIVAQGVVCPTVYNLKDRKENGPYAQSSWFMRPNVPGDIWGFEPFNSNYGIGLKPDVFNDNSKQGMFGVVDLSDIENPEGVKHSIEKGKLSLDSFKKTRGSLLYDDVLVSSLGEDYNGIDATHEVNNLIDLTQNNAIGIGNKYEQDATIRNYIINKGSWLEFRHNYALRSKGWSFGNNINTQQWTLGKNNNDLEFNYIGKFNDDVYPGLGSYTTYRYESTNNTDFISAHKLNFGSSRVAELDNSRFGVTPMFNRFSHQDNMFIKSVYSSKDNIIINKVSEEDCNTGSSAYYVDSSIVTLNSPEIELVETLHDMPTSNLKFRIIGMIPITANAADSSLTVDNGPYNPSDRTDVGYKKVSIQTLNIGYTAFRGMVAHNLFYGGDFGEPQYQMLKQTADTYNNRYLSLDEQRHKETSYSYSSLHPWQSTGYISGFPNMYASGVIYSKLKRKVLSNIRYSASTYFFNDDEIDIKEDNKYYKQQSEVLGWQPMSGSVVSLHTSSDNSIIKIPQETYKQHLVYKGNIDTLALAQGGNSPLPTYTSLFGRKLRPGSTLVDSGSAATEGALFSENVYKTAVAASIKYKSSPHFVVSFNNVNWRLTEKSNKVQEILPALGSKYERESITTYNLEGIDTKLPDEKSKNIIDATGTLYEDNTISAVPHQSIIKVGESKFGLPGYNAQPKNNISQYLINYGWLWLGEVYRDQDPIFGGDTEYSLQNNLWESANTSYVLRAPQITKLSSLSTWAGTGTLNEDEFKSILPTIYKNDIDRVTISDFSLCQSANPIHTGNLQFSLNIFLTDEIMPLVIPVNSVLVFPQIAQDSPTITIDNISYQCGSVSKSDGKLVINMDKEVVGVDFPSIGTFNVPVLTTWNTDGDSQLLKWEQGDTYYQRFDTLKTYAYSEEDENSIVDITSFMVETRLNIDGRYDRNRGQESNLTMSPTNFNLINDVYSQRDNFFTYRILDDDVQARTTFPNQITWSLSKTAGESIDAWMNVTLANVLDLDGTKGKLTALKTFNNNIIALQDSGIAQVLFNSRVQIPTSESVPIQIANSGKVDGAQYLTQEVGCQDKWNIVSTTNGLYFVDYYNKSIYRFNGKLEDLSTQNGFRGWCNKYITSSSNVIGYYDIKNKEIIYYDPLFRADRIDANVWLGFNELTNTFSSFYTYPKAILTKVNGEGLWLYGNKLHAHQKGDYNKLLSENSSIYGINVITRQDSNIVKTFNNVEFRADTYSGENHDCPLEKDTFNTISIWTEPDGLTEKVLSYETYIPSNLKKKLRTWRANIPRVQNKYKRYVNQWAKVGLWETNPATEKTILHDMSVIYSE